MQIRNQKAEREGVVDQARIFLVLHATTTPHLATVNPHIYVNINSHRAKDTSQYERERGESQEGRKG